MSAMSALAYLRSVQAALTSEGQSPKLDQTEYEVVTHGQRYGVGPGDCAAQIRANREDATDHTASAVVYTGPRLVASTRKPFGRKGV